MKAGELELGEGVGLRNYYEPDQEKMCTPHGYLYQLHMRSWANF